MIGYWISFGLFFPFILFVCFGFKILAKQNNKVEITPEMDAQSIEELLDILFSTGYAIYFICLALSII